MICSACRECTTDAACDDGHGGLSKNDEINDYADPCGREHWCPCSVHMGHLQPVDILVNEENQ